MGWRGIAIGGCVGSLLGGQLGAVLGAMLGHRFEQRMAGGRRRASGPRRQAAAEHRQDAVAAAYATLGASPADADDELKRKYRELVKRNHPDAMRARGLSEAEVGKATERMARLNEAWAAVCAAREAAGRGRA